MPERTLGLDVGPTSVGWALVEVGDEGDGRIVAAGVRVFPEGVDRDQQGGEQSKSQGRRTARAMRRQISRRSARKRLLRECLVRVGLLPHEPEAMKAVLAWNPYELRRRALEETLQPYEIGRVLLHLNQRRGFLSNRKTDKAREADTKGMLAEMNELAAKMKQTGSRTLGEYLAGLHAQFDHRRSAPGDKVRSRHTRRDMYEAEFEAIWESQRRFHPALLTDALEYGRRGKQKYPAESRMLGRKADLLTEYGIHGLIFFQRKMYWPRSVVGRCELEPKQKRCPRADRAAQRFRLLQEVNNLRYFDPAARVERALSPEQRASVLELLSFKESVKFDDIRQRLSLPENVRFNLERGERDKLQGHVTDARLAKKGAVGKRWKDLPDQVRDAVVDVLLHEEREDEALARLVSECGLTPEEAQGALGVSLPDGYMNFSRVAILKLLPHLERGLVLMADDPSNSAIHAAGYLRPDERAVGQRDLLPPSPMLTNPIVRQALVEVRKVVNAVIREYGKPDRIHVELAREAKKSFEERRRLRLDIKKRRQQREGAAAEIDKCGVQPTRATVDRYLLWKEQQEFCPYCGQKIGLLQLFNAETDVDHILPRWRSLDNSLANKVLCHRACNRDKGDQTPREWLEGADPERYERVLRIAEKLPYGKRRKFAQKDIILDDFVKRQLVDTAYISRAVSQYLRCLGVEVACGRGDMTAELRHWWGLDTILDPDARGEKIRADHRHHAIDAITIALTNRKRLHALANARGKDMPPPWNGFRDDVVAVVEAIRVSHRALRRLHGALHEETFYGTTNKPKPDQVGPRPWAKGWIEQEGVFVRRKYVTELTNTKHLQKVRDPSIREILRRHLLAQGIDPDKPGKIPGNAFKGDHTPRMPSGVPIRKVRLLEESETFRPVSSRRPYQYVKPGSNHHIVYRVRGEGDKAKWTAEVVPMWDAALHARREERPLVDRADNAQGRFLMSLSIGEMFEMDAEDGARALCVVRKLDQRSRYLYYKSHTDAREADQINAENLYLSPVEMQKRHARKVVVDPIGRLRYAND